MSAGHRRESGYLLLFGATMALRERAIAATLRAWAGPIATISATPHTRYGKFFDHVIRGVSSDPELALKAVISFEKETGLVPHGAVPFIDGNLMAGLAIAEYYDLPFLSRSAVVDSSINKNLMKDRFRAAGVATPRYVQVRDLAGAEAAAAEFGLPCVIKPSAFGGSLGVRLVRDPAELAEAYAYVNAIIAQAAATFSVKNRSVQVEEFCTLTDEVSVELLNDGDRRTVLAVVDKSLGPWPYFAEIGHRVPSRYSDRQDVVDLAVAACAAIDLDRGLAHVELRVEPGKAPQVIEVGARTAGDGILDLVERVTGVSPYELHVRSYLKSLPGPVARPEPAGVAAIAVLKAPAGRIAEIRSPRSVPPEVVEYEVYAQPGHESAAVSANYLTREGYVECFWPAEQSATVDEQAHLAIAKALSEQLFAMAEPPGA